MHIVPRITKIIKRKILPKVPGKLKGMMMFGINTLSLTAYKSLNENARVSGGGQSQQADLMKMFRLVRSVSARWCFYRLISTLGKINSDLQISSKSVINVDLTEFLPFALLVFSLQTKFRHKCTSFCKHH
jgi:hypothetical protein